MWGIFFPQPPVILAPFCLSSSSNSPSLLQIPEFAPHVILRSGILRRSMGCSGKTEEGKLFFSGEMPSMNRNSNSDFAFLCLSLFPTLYTLSFAFFLLASFLPHLPGHCSSLYPASQSISRLPRGTEAQQILSRLAIFSPASESDLQAF